MKKLFFAAILATVAIGGAFSVKATPYYTLNQGGVFTTFNCVEDADIQCSTIEPTIYSTSVRANQDEDTEVDKLDLVGTFYN